MISPGDDFAAQAAACRTALLEHPLYQKLQTLEDLALFMEHHVFAVWDFMSLLKALQQKLTCTTVPWMPVGDRQVRRLVNEIVLGEESDLTPEGMPASHYELYLAAMEEAGASPARVQGLLESLMAGMPLEAALQKAAVPGCVARFVQDTFAVIQRGQVHEIAAAFTYGREDLIPSMFHELVERLEAQFPGRLATLRYYLDRHIQLDGDEHGEMGRQMVSLLCRGEHHLEQEAGAAALAALQSRLRLWDGIAASIGN